ncbi:LBL_2463 family protein [Leptospira alstonii]|uniref:Uncharacterized protein n=2 Tax=Leptospira alstonii TaxID=28452 RepID=M6CQE8_9LEPT|nr:hypothetical protein [Leptospira alstonii]EMJ92766.1 hypothetical protein LEP1GSC194_2358 [Leptospira alstonii serovar Sichuan str. 79601]EQA82140.1 hypothetical protein LEP1GSC193_0366 [Leptospira alstonii serovar Pingchang str. 80-412]
MSQTLEQTEVKKIVGLEAPEELERVKSFVSKVYQNAGYSHSPWKSINYDPWSTWFYAEGQDGLLAAMRIVEKFPWNFIPLEVAIVHRSEPKMRYAVIEENVADWSAVAFQQTREAWKEAKRISGEVAKHCIEKGYEIIYGMYPLELVGIKNVYLNEGAVASEKYVGPMYFPDFYLRGKTCLLNVIELEKPALQKLASKYL